MSHPKQLQSLSEALDAAHVTTEKKSPTINPVPASVELSSPAFSADCPLYYKPHGACTTVTGSAHFLYHAPSKTYLAVDCGLVQGEDGNDGNSTDDLPVSPADIKVLFLTHAHVDHIGNLVAWLRAGFRGIIYCTKVTADLTQICLEDSLGREHQLEESQALLDLLPAMFRCPDADADRGYEKSIPVEGVQGLNFSMHPTSHLIGCVAIRLTAFNKGYRHLSILFSGDIGPIIDQKMHGGLAPARLAPRNLADVIVLESTYGDRPARAAETLTAEGRLGSLADVIAKTSSKGPGATLIIPTFSLGRTTDLLADLVVILGTMRARTGIAATDTPRIYINSQLAERYATALRDAYATQCENCEYRWLNDDSRLMAMGRLKLLRRILSPDTEPRQTHATADGNIEVIWGRAERGDSLSIILAGSGTTGHGTIQRYIMDHATDVRATVALVGYCPENSLGAHLREITQIGVENRERERPLCMRLKNAEDGSSRFWEIAADAVKMDLVDISPYYSGHADADSLIAYATADNPVHEPMDIILVHGTKQSRAHLAYRLKAEPRPGCRPVREVHCPSPAYPWFDIAHRRWNFPDLGELRTSMVLTMAANPEYPPNARSLAKGILKSLRYSYPELVPNLETPGGIARFRASGTSEGMTIRHDVSVSRKSDLEFFVHVESKLFECQTIGEFKHRCFPWESVLRYLRHEFIGYRPVGTLEEVNRLLDELADPDRSHPVFLVTKIGRDNTCAKFLSKHMGPQNTKTYLVLVEGRDNAAAMGLSIKSGMGLYYPADANQPPTEFSMLHTLDKIPELLALINAADDASRARENPQNK